MPLRVMILLLAVVVFGAVTPHCQAGDEQAAAQPQAKPAPKAALTTGQPITVTFKYGDEDPNLTFSIVDDRPITAETTVSSVLAKTARAASVFRPVDAMISVIRPHAEIDDELSVKVTNETLKVVWDLVANTPTEKTNYKLQAGDQIQVWQPAPAAGQGFIPLAPKPPQTGRWTPTIPPPPEVDPLQPAAVAYAAAPAGRPQSAGQLPASRYSATPVPVPNPTLLNPTATALPFFGRLAVVPEPMRFREYIEQTAGPKGETIAVRRRVPDPPQIKFTMHFIQDPAENLQALPKLRDKGLIIGDTETLTSFLHVLEKNALIPDFDGETGLSGPLGQVMSSGLKGDRTELDQLTGKTRTIVDAIDHKFELTHNNVFGQLQVEINLRHKLYGKVNEVHTVVEIGRGQSVLARMNAVRDEAEADAAVDAKPMYVLLTPERVPDEAAQPPAPVAAPVPVTAMPIPTTTPPAWDAPIPSVWPQPQQPPRPVAYTAPQREQILPIPRPPGAPKFSAAPAANENRAAANTNKPQIMYNITIVEDLSDSMAEFMPPPGQAQLQLSDSATIRPVLRILEKQRLVMPVANPQLVALADRPATIHVGNDAAPDDTAFQGSHVEIVGREQGGGLAIECKLTQSDSNLKLDASLATRVAQGQTIIARTTWQEIKKGADAEKSADNETKNKRGKNPVYIVITPELLQ